LSPSRYVGIIEEEEYRSIKEIFNELNQIEEKKKIEEKIKNIFEKLN